MTEVIERVARTAIVLALTIAAGTSLARGQAQTPMPSTAQLAAKGPQNPRLAEQLYLQLRSADLDPGRVYHIREASLDRKQLHITLEDGTIAFTKDVAGRVTGAFFEGEGEVLLVPTNQAERASMSLFTGAAILEEQFSTAYFRFNDDTYRDLETELRETEDKDFAARWSSTALNLAEWDALRLFVTFSKYLPAEGSSEPIPSVNPPDRFLHARVQGDKLGAFDVYYDSTASEPIAAAQQKTVEGVNYYNVWAALTTPPSSAAKESARTDEIAIRSYRIDSEVTPPTNLHAVAVEQVEVLRSGARTLLFELSRYLQVSEVIMEGTPLEFIQNQALEGSQLALRGNDILAVVFPHPLRAGDKFQLRFTYGGTVLSEAGSGLLYVGARGTWYPNRGLATADFDLRFRYPAGWTLVATGKRVLAGEEASDSDPPTPAGEQVSRWVTERPIPIAGFNLGRYEKAVAHAENALVETYAATGMERTFPKPQTEAVVVPDVRRPVRPLTPPIVVPQPPLSPARNAQGVAEEAARTLDFYAARFGPYPYGTLGLTQMPGRLSQGWPGLIFLSSFAFLSREEKSRMHLEPVQAILSGLVPAHEIAHQWWGDLVFWKSYRDQWISEGLSNYCSLMMLESRDPAGFRAVLQQYRDALLRKNKSGSVLKDAGPVTLGLRLSSFAFPDGYEAISYGRGTWLFHMLRTMLEDAERGPQGRSSRDVKQTDEAFLRALRRVRERFAGKPITTQELMEVFAEDLPPSLRYEGKKSLDWFYQGWINGTAVPKLELQTVKIIPKGTSVVVTGSIVQKDAPPDLVTSVPLYASLGGERRVLLGRVFADGAQSSFRLTAPAGTRRVLLDPEQTILTSPR